MGVILVCHHEKILIEDVWHQEADEIILCKKDEQIGK
jgi:hypothetical protein